MAAIIMGLRDSVSSSSSSSSGVSNNNGNNNNNNGFYSPFKEKSGRGGGIGGLFNTSTRSLRIRLQLFGAYSKIKLVFSLCILFALFLIGSKIAVFMGWNPHYDSSVASPSRGGYTVLINTWKRNSLLKQAVAHYASCSGADAIHVVWSESDPPSDSLRAYLKKIVYSKSQTAHKPNFRFDLNEEDNLNNRFKPIEDLRTDAIFSIDDDVVVPCSTLDFAFTVWKSAPSTMVGFVPRMHWLDVEKDAYYKYGGWWSVWWTGTYSMVLSKAAFFHKKYLDMYTYDMPSSIHDYVTRERNCEDIAMSLLVANATGAPPIWVQGKIYEIGSSGISSLNGHSKRRDKCLNDFISLYGEMPLVSTNAKAVDAVHEWFCPIKWAARGHPSSLSEPNSMDACIMHSPNTNCESPQESGCNRGSLTYQQKSLCFALCNQLSTVCLFVWVNMI